VTSCAQSHGPVRNSTSNYLELSLTLSDVGGQGERSPSRRSACESQLIGLLAVANRTGLTGHASGLVRGVVLGFGEAWRLSPTGDRPRTPARCWRCGPGCAAKGFSFTGHGGHQRGAGTHQATDAIASGQCALGYRGRIGGTRKRGSTVASNRVIALTRSPEREKTSTPLGWAMPDCGSGMYMMSAGWPLAWVATGRWAMPGRKIAARRNGRPGRGPGTTEIAGVAC